MKTTRAFAAVLLIILASAAIAVPAGAEPSCCPYDPHLSIMYNYLTGPQRELYDRMYDALWNGKSSADIPAGLSRSEVDWMIDYIYNEAPELCAYDRWATGSWTAAGDGRTVRLAYKLPLSVQRSFVSQVTKTAAKFAGKDDKTGIKSINDYLIREFEYGTAENGDDTQLAYFALKHKKALCNGYAQCAAMFSHFAGYSCSYIDGQVYETNGKHLGSHAWNVALTGTEFAWFDATWDDAGKKPRRDWFLLSGEKMGKTHRPDPEYRPIAGLKSFLPDKASFTMHLDINNAGGFVRGAAEGKSASVKQAALKKGEYYAPALVIWNNGRPLTVTVSYSLDGKKETFRETAIAQNSNGAFRTFAGSLKGKAGRHSVTWYYNGLRLGTFTWTVK